MKCVPVAVIVILFCLIIPVSVGADSLAGDDSSGDLVTEEYLSGVILNLLDSQYMGGDCNNPGRDTVINAAFVYASWGGMPLVITDSSGAEVTLDRPIRRAVVFNGETTETLRSIGFPMERIVGIDKYTKADTVFFPEFADTKSIGSVWSPDYEQIVVLNPDTVFLYGTSSNSSCNEIAEKLSSTIPDVRILRFDCFKPTTYESEITALGAVTGRKEGAEDFRDFYLSVMEPIKENLSKIPENERVRVYFETWVDYKTGSAGSGYQEKITLAGGENIFADEPTAYPVIDPESVIILNPGVIIKLVGSESLSFGGYNGNDIDQMEKTYLRLSERPGWNSLQAVQDDRMHIIHNDIFGGPEFFIGTAYSAKWFYPEIFGSLNPGEIHREYIERFQRSDCNAVTDGAFVYP
ncbi:MAG: ABC transporter substrate-binding protein [Euryarchaeota archaeon]|nr:ABC transporter substrate-binding protein [Euryarchaeota archaeon]